MKRWLAGVALAAMAGPVLAQTAEQRLFDAIEAGKPLAAEGIVLKGEAKLDARKAGRETPLHAAIEKGYRELAELLVRKGAPLAARTQNGETPLHFAALHSDTWFVDLLLGALADPNARNNDGESVLQWAVMTGNPMTAKRLLEGGRRSAPHRCHGQHNPARRGGRQPGGHGKRLPVAGRRPAPPQPRRQAADRSRARAQGSRNGQAAGAVREGLTRRAGGSHQERAVFRTKNLRASSSASIAAANGRMNSQTSSGRAAVPNSDCPQGV